MSITVTPVRFEHHREALGIGETTPRLSWVVAAAPSGWRQARYEVEGRAADAAGPAASVVAVDSADSVLVPWPFSPSHRVKNT